MNLKMCTGTRSSRVVVAEEERQKQKEERRGANLKEMQVIYNGEIHANRDCVRWLS
jgi:hypothetical protein